MTAADWGPAHVAAAVAEIGRHEAAATIAVLTCNGSTRHRLARLVDSRQGLLYRAHSVRGARVRAATRRVLDEDGQTYARRTEDVAELLTAQRLARLRAVNAAGVLELPASCGCGQWLLSPGYVHELADRCRDTGRVRGGAPEVEVIPGPGRARFTRS